MHLTVRSHFLSSPLFPLTLLSLLFSKFLIFLLTKRKKEFFGLVRGEVEIESQNIFYRPENKTNNQNLLSTQDFLSSHFDKLSNNVQTYLTEIQTISHESQLVRGTKGNVNYSSSIERRAQKFANFVNSQADWTSVPYEEAVMNITFIKEVEQKKEYYESTISHCKLKLTEEEKDKQRILIELSQTKDALASKQSQMNSLLTELASSRQQYENLVRFFFFFFYFTLTTN